VRALSEGLKTRAIEALERDGTVYYELEPYRWLEERIAARLKTLLLNTTQSWPAIDADKAIAWSEGQVGLRFEAAQAAAIRVALGEKVSVITGGPGVGKTTILRGLLKILKARRLRVLLAARPDVRHGAWPRARARAPRRSTSCSTRSPAEAGSSSTPSAVSQPMS